MSGDWTPVIGDLEGAKIWCILNQFGGMSIYTNEDYARDHLTRKDKLYSYVITQFKEEP